MQISNVRLGHANNSSSSHSILFVNSADYEDAEVDWQGRFGWDNFVAASLAAKQLYVAATLYRGLRDVLGSYIAQLVVRDLCGLPELPGDLDVDHESAIVIPRPHRGTLDWSEQNQVADLAFAHDLAQFLTQDGVVILGGNDNEDPHPLAEGATFFKSLPWELDGPAPLISRKDGDFWILFNQETGAKMRFSFSDMKGLQFVSSSKPELVDLKITDHCPFACSFCYQDSTSAGKPAKFRDIETILGVLSGWGVFEVAIGGGEPTLYPRFVDVLAKARGYDIVPNFTTKSLSWLRGPDARRILDLCGSFAYSTQEPNDLAKLRTALDFVGEGKHYEVSVQCIPELMSQYTLSEMLKAAAEYGFNVTLLGYKRTGRGQIHADSQALRRDWPKALKSMKDNYVRVSVDTVIAQDEKLMRELRVSERTYHTQEGAFSCYIDAVAKTWGPSSYAPERMVPWFGRSSEERLATYQSWSPQRAE